MRPTDSPRCRVGATERQYADSPVTVSRNADSARYSSAGRAGSAGSGANGRHDATSGRRSLPDHRPRRRGRGLLRRLRRQRPSDEPDPQDAATALASGLTAKDLSKVAFTSDTATTAQASYDRIIAGDGRLGDAPGRHRRGQARPAPPRRRPCTGRGTSPRRRRGSTTPRPSSSSPRTAGRWPGRRRSSSRRWSRARVLDVVLGAGRPRRHPRRRRPADRDRAAGVARRHRQDPARRRPIPPLRLAPSPSWSVSTPARTSRRSRPPARRRSSRRSPSARRSCRPR